MANREACELYIEQEIKDLLSQGKKPHFIGKELSQWTKKMFEVTINPKTIASRAYRHPDFPSNEGNKIKNSPQAKHGSPQRGEVFIAAEENLPQTEPDLPESNEQFRTSFTGKNEWYTPTKYIESARKVMGTINIDPASSKAAQERIKAGIFHTEGTDGLKHSWNGSVWLNPPYSQPLIYLFIDKLIREYDRLRTIEAILLTHNYTDTAWFHLAESRAELICFTKGRIRFEDQDGNLASPTQGSAFFYFGENVRKFISEFEQYGFIR